MTQVSDSIDEKVSVKIRVQLRNELKRIAAQQEADTGVRPEYGDLLEAAWRKTRDAPEASEPTGPHKGRSAKSAG